MKKVYLCSVLAAMLYAGTPDLSAQAVIFPQIEQPGKASLAQADGVYTLSNNLLTATYVSADNTLKFGGCPQMKLNAGTELFRLKVAGETVKASELTLKSLSLQPLTANNDAAKGSERFDGQALVAEFEGKGLAIVWRAVLRDDSHYLRTEMELTPLDGDVDLSNITAMIYDVDNAEGNNAPQVVGNTTRGAILASSSIFAGLETPMGLNTVLSPTSGFESFTAKSWTESSFSWLPGDDTPAGILALKTISGGASLAQEDIVGTRGFVVFRETGEQTITFNYSSGSHRINVVGVDICDPVTGKVIASDYHAGYSGNNKQDNVYKLNIPEATTYVVRYFVEVKTESITSTGSIAYSCRTAVPNVVFGEDPSAQAKSPVKRALSTTDLNVLAEGDTETDSWTPQTWTKTGADNVPDRIKELGVNASDVKHMDRKIGFNESATLTVEFLYSSGNNRLDVCGVELRDAEGNTVVSDFHTGFTGHAKLDNVYKFEVPYAGEYTLRYYTSNTDAALDNTGNINLSYIKEYTVYLPAPESMTIEGSWPRKIALAAGKTWKVNSVVGIMAPDQQRRSVQAYVERERAQPWRVMPMYNSWFELCIDRNNDPNYTTNMNANQCLEVMEQWKTNLYDQHKVNIKSFVWDDGWDIYGTWEFNPNFPNGFADLSKKAEESNTHIGAWLGPVGGYGQSGNYRRNYWKDKGGMQLSNPAYYDVFLKQTTMLMTSYEFNYFKLDGISDLFHAEGPKAGQEEGAEAIIEIEHKLREIKPDVFLNTTVGTWASPFWYTAADCTWRQEQDFGQRGNNSLDREKWITYRDDLIYDVYVKKSPLCPINSIMSHGFILSEKGAKYSQNYDAVVREMHCAFASGTSMVELYCDFALMNEIEGKGKKGQLWADLAECIRWQENNADVLPDAHWVGGRPWTGTTHEIYGWASWNGTKSTLALRNGDNNAKSITTTLRKALDIPAYVTGTIRLKHSFADQAELEGLPLDTPIDIDKEMTLTLSGSSVYCYDGIEGNTAWPVYPGNDQSEIEEIKPAPAADADNNVYDLLGRKVINPSNGFFIKSGKVVRM